MKSRKILIGLAFFALLSNSAFSDQAITPKKHYPINSDEINFLFKEGNKESQIYILSRQEMHETKGAWAQGSLEGYIEEISNSGIGFGSKPISGSAIADFMNAAPTPLPRPIIIWINGITWP